MLLLYVLARLLRRFHHQAICVALSLQLAWAPVQHARAAAPLIPVAVAIAVFARAVFTTAVTRMGAQITYQNVAAGTVIAGSATLMDRNWDDVVQYVSNSTPSYGHGVSNGVPSFASMAASVGQTSVSTDTTSYSYSVLPGAVNAQVGNVPMKDPIAADNDSGPLPSTTRWDGYKKYTPLADSSFSTVWNSSGFKSYLCPVLSPALDEPAASCRTLPEMPYAQYKYQSQYQSIGAGCMDANTCAQAYVAARLTHLTGTIASAYGTNAQGLPYYQMAIENVTTNYASCYDTRYSQYTMFGGYRCPVTLSYSQAYLQPGQTPTFNTVTENLVVDVTLIRPAISTGTSLNDYIDRYPAAGMEPIVPTSLANVFNAIFQSAASRAGYSGINYFPITAADVTAAAQPGEIVPLGELVKPIPASGTGAQPGTGNPTAPGGSTTIDLGPNPGIATPTLEGVPTAAQIMSPIFDLFPSLRSFTVPGHASQCPPLSLPLWGQEVSTNKHCEVMEAQRGTLGAVSLVAWSIAAIIIVLGA